jgi:hypothetical protein
MQGVLLLLHANQNRTNGKFKMIEDNVDKVYKDECDRLATIEVQNCHTFFGRWFIDDQMLCTWVCLPDEKDVPLKKANLFCYAIEKLRNDKGQSEFLTQISEFNWLGGKGRKDLMRVLKYFKKHCEE